MSKFKYKGLMFLSLIIILCLSISMVSAVEGSTADIIVNDVNDLSTISLDAQDIRNDVSKYSSTESDLSSDSIVSELSDSNSNTFATIQAKIDNAKSGDIIKLSGTYIGNGTAINVNKALTIDGCGATLDAKNLSRIFYVNTNNCIIKNLKFKNACEGYDEVSIAGAIYWNGSKGNLINCTFEGITVIGDGGAVYWAGANGTIKDCTFNVTSAYDGAGGAVYWAGANGVLANSKFFNSLSDGAGSGGGAIFWTGGSGLLANCTFVNLSSYHGGALYLIGNNMRINNCSFENVTATGSSGGAICWAGNNGSLNNSSFLNSKSANSAGSIYWTGSNATVNNTCFINSHAISDGFSENTGSAGTIYLTNSNAFINNCTFINCSSTIPNLSPIKGRGGAVSLGSSASNSTINNCTFENCYSPEAGAVYWQGNLGTMNNSNFINCSSSSGGSVYWLGSDGSLSNCTFIGSTANSTERAVSGSVSWTGNNGKLTDSVFINSTAYSTGDDGAFGGAIMWMANSGLLANCSFVNSLAMSNTSNVAMAVGGAVSWFGSNGNILDCNFTDSSTVAIGSNSTSNGGALYLGLSPTIVNNCTFVNSSATTGHAIYTIVGDDIYNSTFVMDEDESRADMVYNTSVSTLLSQNNKFLDFGVLILYQSGTYYQNKNLTVKLTDTNNNPISDENVIIKFSNGVSVNLTTNANGIVTYNIPFAPGNYTAVASVHTVNVFSNSNFINISISPLKTSTSISECSGEYGSTVNFTATVSNNDSTVNEGIVSFYVDGSKVGSASVVDGVATYVYTCSKAGNFVLKAIYEGSDIYGSSEASSNLSVSKLNTTISMNSFNSSYKSKVNFTAIVNSKVVVNEGIVSFYVDGSKVGSASVVDGVATYVYTCSDIGTFSVQGIYEDNNDFTSSENTSTLTVNKAQATLTITQSGSYYKATKLTVKLVSADGTILSNEKVVLNIGGKSVNLTTNNDGVATYNVALAPGTYTAKATVSSDKVSSTATKSVTIKKATNVTITPTKLTTTYNSGKYFVVKVTKGTTPMVGVKLSLKIYTGKTYKTVTVVTNASGIAKYAASKLATGTHKVIVSSAESKNYMTATSKTSSVVVNKAPTTVSAPKVTNKYKANNYFKVTVKNKATGKVVSSLKVVLKVYTGKSYKLYTIKTDANGVASFNTKSLGVGTHKVVLSSGNSYYTINATSSIVIKK